MGLSAAMPDEPADAFRAAYRAVRDSGSLRHYAEFREEFDSAMSNIFDELAPSALGDYRNIDALREEYAAGHSALPSNPVKYWPWYFVLVIIPFLGAVLPFVRPVLPSNPLDLVLTNRYATALFIYVLSVAGTVWLVVVGARRRRRHASFLRKIDERHARQVIMYNQAIDAAVKEAFNRVMNRVLGPKGMLNFPTEAPRLVELETSAIVPSSSLHYVREFIAGHESSAIGIAGPRGIGKSTLMRALATDAELNPLPVTLTAPVKYNAIDFLRRLYLDVAVKVCEEYRVNPQPVPRNIRYVGRMRFYFGPLAIWLGLMLVGLDLFNMGTALGLTELAQAFGPWGMAGLGFVTAGAYFVAMHRPGRSWATSGPDPVRRALTAIRDLTYDSETNTKSKNAGKFLGGQFSVEDEESHTLKSRSLTEVDLVSGLRDLLRTFADGRNPRPVLVIIDELDKISTTDDLIATVNGLKDLFHVQGVHFVVSVSTDALRSFERRGLTTRDAFDSAFDTIVPITPLSVSESLQVLASRAEGFPPLLASFCHAWSGGLPRDLLRTARRCVEVQRGESKPLLVSELIRRVVTAELVAIVQAEMRAPLGPEELGDFAAGDDALWRIWEDLHGRCRPETCGFEISPDQPHYVIRAVAKLGEMLAGFFEQLEIDSARGWRGPSASTKDVVEHAATAMLSRAEPDRIRNHSFEAAWQRLGSCLSESVLGKSQAESLVTVEGHPNEQDVN